MKITVGLPFEREPLPDFQEDRYYMKMVEVEISDEDIVKMGKRYFELINKHEYPFIVSEVE